MPPALAGVAALAITAAASTVIGSKIALAAIGMVSSLAFNFIASAINKPQQAGSASSGQATRQQVDNKITVKQAAAARPVVYGTARVAGIYADLFSTDNNAYLHAPICFVGHEIEEFTEIWVNDEIVSLSEFGLVTSGKYAGHIGINRHLGSVDQVADASLVANSYGRWTASDRLQGIAWLYVRFTWNAQVFNGSLPNITVVVRGKKDIYDPVSETTGWTANAALCQANYLTDSLYGIGVDYEAAIDEAALVVARNLGDEDVALDAGGTEKRYECNGVFLSSEKPRTVLGWLLAASHGKAVYDGDKWRIQAAGWVTPDFTLTQDHLRGEVDVQVLAGIRQNFNAVKGTYIGPLNRWQVADFPPLVSELYKARDGGETAYSDFEFKFVKSPSQCQRLAKIDLLQSRQEIRVKAECNLSVWQVLTGDNLLAELPRYGWEEKPFEVMGVDFLEGADRQGNPVPGVDLLLRETAAEIYDWNTSEESAVDPAPNTSFPDVFTVLPPSNLQVSESLYFTRGVGVKARAVLAWDPSADAFVTSGGRYRAQFRTAGFPDWITIGEVTDLRIEVPDIGPGIYDFRVMAINWAGNPSDPVVVQQYIAGLSTPPAPPVSFTVEAMESFALARAARPTDLDVEHGGWVVFKHAPVMSGASWSTALTLSDPLPANAGAWALPLKAGTYLLEIYDSSGNPSGTPATFYVDQSSAHDFVPLSGGLATFDPDFAGTKVGCGAVGGVLTLAGTGLISAIPAVSAVRSIAYYGGVATSGYVDYAAVMDLLTKKRHRLTNTVEASIVSVIDRISERSNNVSDWPRIGNGATGDEADSRLLVASTDDDPAGAPVWSDWLRLDSSTFNCRAHKFRRVLEAYDPTFTPGISGDAVVAEGV